LFEEPENIDMKLNVMKSQIVSIGMSHSKAANDVVISDKSIGYVDELKYLGWYILWANVFRISLHHMQVCFFQCFIALISLEVVAYSSYCNTVEQFWWD